MRKLLLLLILPFISQAQTVWTGPMTTFTKANYADWTLEENQDRITDNVWITRKDQRAIFNIAVENESPGGCSSTAPALTQWAIGTTAQGVENLTFGTFYDAHDCSPPSILNVDMVLKLTAEDVYIDIKFLGWTNNADGGGFSYMRSTSGESSGDAGILLNGVVSAESNQIKNVAEPTDAQDAATKNYVDSAGIQGPAGPQGEQGIQGPAGPQGPQGAAGNDGVAGPQGPQGETGATGPTGPTGPQGIQGVAGADGTNGSDGADGSDGFSAYEIWVAAGNTGTESDFLASLVGAQGEQGIQGPQGETGATGATGPAGPQGPAGPAGPVGPAGSQGPQGAQGNDGADGQGGVTTVGDGLTLTGSGTESDPYMIALPPGGSEGQVLTIINGVPAWADASNSSGGGGNENPCTGTTVLSVGDYAQGGVVFWVDPSDSTKGLVCAISDQSSAVSWNGGNPTFPSNATNTAVGAGSSNTDQIISAFGLDGNDYAARLAYNFNGGGYNDWFLPSRDELLEIYANKSTVNSSCISNGGDSLSENDWYWSSSVSSTDQSLVWEVDMSNGNQQEGNRVGNNVVRAIRSYHCDSAVDEGEGSISDVDGNSYDYLTYGDQQWTVTDAAMTTYRDGTPIPQVIDPTEWSNLTTGAWSYFDNDPSKSKIYNWYAVAGIHDAASLSDPSLRKEFAPEGWHVPTNDEWSVFENYLISQGYNFDSTTIENKIAKAVASNSGWEVEPNESTPGGNQSLNNSSGFNAYPNGYRINNSGIFNDESRNAAFWLADTDGDNANHFLVSFNSPSTTSFAVNKRYGLSVRFVKD